jgi:hypothetical protein
VPDIKFEIIDHLKVLSEGSKGWTKEVNIISWNNRKPKVDIRDWDEAHEKMGKGITLTKDELVKLKELLNGLNLDELDIS